LRTLLLEVADADGKKATRLDYDWVRMRSARLTASRVAESASEETEGAREALVFFGIGAQRRAIKPLPKWRRALHDAWRAARELPDVVQRFQIASARELRESGGVFAGRLRQHRAPNRGSAAAARAAMSSDEASGMHQVA